MGLTKDQNCRSLSLMAGAGIAAVSTFGFPGAVSGIAKSIQRAIVTISASDNGCPAPGGGISCFRTFRIKKLFSDAPFTATGPLVLPLRNEVSDERSSAAFA